jgi:FtsP/CotA-like multicopper oxidase with cupredoxin domain
MTMQRLFATLALSACAISSSGISTTAQSPEPAADWNTALSLQPAPDLNPDPQIVEINLDARVTEVDVAPGRRIEAWTYNGSLPGPLIRVKVGDRLIVHFTNKLPQPTTVHWHGLRIPNAMDGVPILSQPDVKPGETFTYDFVVPDAGLYWYHPHVMSAAQAGFGLYGAFLVDDPSEGFTIPDEHVLVLSDIDVTAAGKLEDPETGGSAGMAFGREGNVLLLNGRNHPRVQVAAGVPQRWRVVNAAKSRYFELDAGADNPFTKIGSDAGFIESPVTLGSLILAPGERADVFFTPHAEPGSELAVRARLVDRGYGSVVARQDEDMFTMVMAGTPAPPPVTLPVTSRAIAPLDPTGATPVPIEFGINQSGVNGAFQYTINNKPLGKFPPVQAKVGETQIWTITNTTPWSHPFHIHGFFFQVLDKDGQLVRPMEWKDTVNVPYKTDAAGPGVVKIIVKYDDRPGQWMIHCHILDHAEGGLMATLQLTRPGEEPAPVESHTTH